MNNGCPWCKAETISEANTKPDDEMIACFLATGAFNQDTKFWRSERKNKEGHRGYWYMSCPECGETGESASNNLQKGKRPCACSPMRQQECYINWLVDEYNNAIAIKFGIANNSKQRIKEQNRFSAYNIKQHSVYTFPSVEQCKKAEREYRQELETGVVLKRDMKDGYTETTWTYNIDKIIEIYERNGGILNE
ncbi:MAG: GIY-YIG nuclease family protein [Bacteroidales bacterium]